MSASSEAFLGVHQSTRRDTHASFVMHQLERALFQSQENARIGRYTLLHLLGEGAFGLVYAARDPKLDRDVAIKVLGLDSAAEGDMFVRREAQTLAQLEHPNVVTVYDVGLRPDEFDGSVELFIVMELVPGKSVAQWLSDTKRSVRATLGVFLDAGRGLAAVHDAGLVHCDFKPSNVLLAADGRAKIADFGLARAVERGVADRTRSGPLGVCQTHIGGTPVYMPPEQLAGEPFDARADQYAFCVALWTAIAGEAPFAGSEIDELLAEKRGAGPRPSAGMPWRLATILRRGLAQSPDERWPNMNELLAELERHARSPWRAGAATVLAGLGLGGIGLGLAFGNAGAATMFVDAPEAARSAVADERGQAEIARLRSLYDAGRWKDARAEAEEILAGGGLGPGAAAEASLVDGAAREVDDEAALPLLTRAYFDGLKTERERIAVEAAFELFGRYRAHDDAENADRWLRHAESAAVAHRAGPTAEAMVDRMRATRAYAERRFDEAVEHAERGLGRGNAQWARTDPVAMQLELTIVLNRFEAEDRERLYEEALEIYERIEAHHGPNHPLVASTLSIISTRAMRLRRLDEAERMMRRAIAIATDQFGPASRAVARYTRGLGTILLVGGDTEAGCGAYQVALAILDGHDEPGNTIRLTTLLNLASCRMRTGGYDEAATLALEAVVLAGKLKLDLEVRALTLAGRARQAQRNYGAAFDLFDQALKLGGERLDAGDLSLAWIHRYAGETAYMAGDRDRAWAHVEAAFASPRLAEADEIAPWFEHRGLWLLRARLLLDDRRHAEAEADFARVLASCGQDECSPDEREIAASGLARARASGGAG